MATPSPETNALDLAVSQPLSHLSADLQTVVSGAAGQAGEGRDFVGAIQDDGIAGLDAVTDSGFQVSSGDLMILGQIQHAVDARGP